MGMSLTRVASLVLAIFLTALQARADLALSPAIVHSNPTAMQLLDIARAGERLVAVGERGLIVLSDDNGASWRQVSVPVSATLTALHFADDELGWVVGHSGVILHTRDGGESWRLQFDGNEANSQFQAYARAQQQLLEAAVAKAEAAGDSALLAEAEYALEDAIFAVEDAATALATGPADPFLDVVFLDEHRGFAVGAYGMLYRTRDGGEQWQLSIDRIDNAERFHYYAITSAGDEHVLLSGEAGLLYRSVDGGEHWQRQEGVYDGSLFGLVSAGDSAWTFGLRGNLFHSDTGGEQWQAVNHDSANSLYGGLMLPDGELLLLGAGGTVLHATAGGDVRFQQHESRASFSAAAVAADGDVWLVGMQGLVELTQGESDHGR